MLRAKNSNSWPTSRFAKVVFAKLADNSPSWRLRRRQATRAAAAAETLSATSQLVCLLHDINLSIIICCPTTATCARRKRRRRREQKDARVCAQLFCFDSASGYCVSYRPAAEGSPCGEGQVSVGRVVSMFAIRTQGASSFPDASHAVSLPELSRANRAVAQS